MKIRVLSRSKQDHVRESAGGVRRIERSFDPALHPFQKAREYTRALNAAKMEKMFAHPFVGALSGHRDGVFCLTRHPRMVKFMFSGACDGEIKIWDLATLTAFESIPGAHQGFVRGIAIPVDGERMFSCGDDKSIKIWNLDSFDNAPVSTYNNSKGKDKSNFDEPVATFLGKEAFTSIDHQYGWTSQVFATSGGSVVDIWDQNRSDPINKFEFGVDTVTSVKFNTVETEIFASTTVERAVALYDLRVKTALKKLVMTHRPNSVSWNPMEAFNFTIASEDHNCYTFDMRKLKSALNVHEGFVSAVLDVDYSPTGREFVAGSYDRSIRIFNVQDGKSKEIYYTKRMQRVFTVKFSGDARFVLSGSDDSNIRLWKSEASKPLGVIKPKEKLKLEYSAKLKERYQGVPEVRRIIRHRHLPSSIYSTNRLKKIVKASVARKERNRRLHRKPGAVKFTAERKKHIVNVLD
eukprot:TRINITY_DN8754_c0_g1_i1.p1 TRINITY_DN8754_c0_g1~~TRINITY_DN8754_c0_g1_i1.p1  ORF type:complete len:464 (+),score=106.88 TRINITY_DN8754_c0_g1_i1:136-1527(+)